MFLRLVMVVGMGVGAAVAQGTFGRARTVHTDRESHMGFAVSEVNLDGRRELLISNTTAAGTGGAALTALLLGKDWRSVATERLIVPPRHDLEPWWPVTRMGAVSADFNGDRLPDIASLNNRGEVDVFLHQGSRCGGSFYRLVGRKVQLRIARKRPGTVMWVCPGTMLADDFTGDGKPDIALCAELRTASGTFSTGMTLLVGDGGGGFSESKIAVGSYVSMCSADVNHDGDPDLIGVTGNGRLCVALHRALGWFRTESVLLSSPARPRFVAMGELTGDDRIDFVVVGDGTDCLPVVFTADARGMPMRSHRVLSRLPLPAYLPQGLVCADLDANPGADVALLLTTGSGPTLVAFASGNRGGTFHEPEIYVLPVRPLPHVLDQHCDVLQAKDLDGDRNPELIVGTIHDSTSGTFNHLVLPNLLPLRAGVRVVGDGSARRDGAVPKISVAGETLVPNRDFALRLAGVPGDGALGVLLMCNRSEPREHRGFKLSTFPLYTFAVQTLGRGPLGGWGVARLPVPDAPVLAEFRYYFQWVVIDPQAANPFGLTSSPSIEVRFAVQ